MKRCFINIQNFLILAKYLDTKMTNETFILNQSIVKAFTLLEAFTNDKKEWGVRELANKTGYNKSTTYRILNTLVALNALQQNENEKYILGSKLFELGNRVSLYESLINTARDSLKKIATDIEETILFAVLKKNKVFYIDKIESPQGLKISTSVGSFQPLHSTAIGKILLAFSTEEKQINLFQSIDYKAYTQHTIINQTQLKSQLKMVHRDQYALDLEEFELGLICIALPVFNKNNEFIGAISASGPSSRFELKKVNHYVSIISKGIKEIIF
jgi:IclR family KDG regulon transcriptional repressor